ncbi:MAG TPA: hypothetical protein VGP02_00730 [Mycobacteriales bacterium]|nr:hypothetical protein [Mycobacteriales bacterium]
MQKESLLFLNRAAVRATLEEIDPVDVVVRVLRRHAAGRTVIPAEGYLQWTNGEGAHSRAIAMLGAVEDEAGPIYGMKLINASLSNPRHGRERAGGFSVLFDPETARPRVLAEAGYLSAIRTAAYTVVSVRHLGPVAWDALGLVGCGTLARAHVDLCVRAFPDARHVHVHDLDPARAAEFVAWVRAAHPHLSARSHRSAADVLAAAPVVVTVTTSGEPYLGRESVRPGTFLAHVSLDDLTEEVFLGAEGLFVDDVDLVRENPRRILGRLLQSGSVVAADDGAAAPHPGRRIDGTLGQVLLGERRAVRPTTGYVVSNPFGMSILDVGLVEAVGRAAEDLELGQQLALY